MTFSVRVRNLTDITTVYDLMLNGKFFACLNVLDFAQANKLCNFLNEHEAFTWEGWNKFLPKLTSGEKLKILMAVDFKATYEAFARCAAVKTFTAFCREADDSGTTWISKVEAESVDNAKFIAVNQCACDWGYEPEQVKCIGILEGEVTVTWWDENS